MANQRREQVGYRRLELNNTLSEGLLDVYRPGGELERKVSSAFFRLADHYGQVADRQVSEDFAERSALTAARTPPGTATVANGAGGGSGRVDENYVRDRLVSVHGWTPQAAAAMAGHAQAESNFNPNAIGDQGSAFGLFQWRGERADALKKFASDRGQRWKDIDAQIDFAVQELAGSEKFAGEQLAAARTVEEAVTALMHYERPAGYSRVNPKGGHNYDGRLQFAMALGPNGSAPAPPQGRPGVPAAAQPPGIVAGEPGQWRPMKGDTVAARAWNAAGTRTYLQTVQTTMEADMATVYERFKDDPAALRRGFDALLTVHMDPKEGHVFPEIEADYRLSFMRARANWEQQADREAEKRRFEADQAQFIERTNDLTTIRQRKLAAITPDNPGGPAMVLETQAELDQHYDDAVARGLMSEGEAAKAKLDSRREAALAFYSRQAETLDADGVAAMRAEMSADFAAGKLPGLDGDGWETLNVKLGQLQRQKLDEDRQANTAYQKRADAMIDRISAGFDVADTDLNQFRMDAGSAPDGEAIRDRTVESIRTARAIRDMTLAEAQNAMTEERRAITPTSPPEAIERYDLMRRVYDAKVKGLSTDPITYAENNGVIPVTNSVTQIEDAGDLAELIAARATNAGLIESHYGVPARYFRPGEAAALQKLVESQPAAVLGVADALASAGPEATPRMLAEIARDAPVLSHVSGLLAMTGDPRIAVEIGEGMQLVATTGFKTRLPAPAKRTQVLTETYGAAFATKPETQARAQKAADLLFERRIAAQGIDTSDFGTAGNAAREAYAQALNDVLGATDRDGVQYGGIVTVNGTETIAPPDMPARNLGWYLSTLGPRDMSEQMPLGTANGVEIRPEQLHRGHLVYVGPGRYRVALGDPFSADPRFVPAADGGYFELDVNAVQSGRIGVLPAGGPPDRRS